MKRVAVYLVVDIYSKGIRGCHESMEDAEREADNTQAYTEIYELEAVKHAR